MGATTKIQWTESSWTPLRARSLAAPGNVGWHCEHVTPGCEHCYAESINKRVGTGLPFKPGHRKDIEIFLDEKMLLWPLHWTRARMIFVCSMTDLFGSFVEDAWIDRMFAVMAKCPQHTFQILTKRPERMLEYCNHSTTPGRVFGLLGVGGGAPTLFRAAAERLIAWPLPNVWLGTSCEDQGPFEDRWPLLRGTKAALRFLSLEPLLGRIDMCEQLKIWWNQRTGDWVREENVIRPDWAIVGGESGHHARPMRTEWAQSLRNQCKGAKIAFFYKQHGEWIDADAISFYKFGSKPDPLLNYADAAALAGRLGKPYEHQSDGTTLIRAGNGLFGRMLDGVEHNEMPKIQGTLL